MKASDKDLFLDINESDIECLRDAIIPLYQNSLIRWASTKAPKNLTMGEVNERVALFIGEVAKVAARQYYESGDENGKQLHPDISKSVYETLTTVTSDDTEEI